MKQLVAFNKKLQDMLSSLNAFMLAVTVFIICLQTFCRFVLKNSPTFTDELARYLFVACVFLGVSVAIEMDSLVRLELFDNYFPDIVMKILTLCRYLLPIIVCAVLGYQSVSLVRMGRLRASTSLPFSMAVPYGIVLLGWVLSLFSSICRLIEFAMGGQKT